MTRISLAEAAAIADDEEVRRALEGFLVGLVVDAPHVCGLLLMIEGPNGSACGFAEVERRDDGGFDWRGPYLSGATVPPPR